MKAFALLLGVLLASPASAADDPATAASKIPRQPAVEHATVLLSLRYLCGPAAVSQDAFDRAMQSVSSAFRDSHDYVTGYIEALAAKNIQVVLASGPKARLLACANNRLVNPSR